MARVVGEYVKENFSIGSHIMMDQVLDQIDHYLSNQMQAHL